MAWHGGEQLGVLGLPELFPTVIHISGTSPTSEAQTSLPSLSVRSCPPCFRGHERGSNGKVVTLLRGNALPLAIGFGTSTNCVSVF